MDNNKQDCRQFKIYRSFTRLRQHLTYSRIGGLIIIFDGVIAPLGSSSEYCRVALIG